jgi:hypothetical protein
MIEINPVLGNFKVQQPNIQEFDMKFVAKADCI